MKHKTIQFLAELHRKLYKDYMAERATFVFAESMDDFCLGIGYASAVAAYEDLPEDIKNFVHMSKNKSNPIFYMHIALVATPHDVLFVDVSEGNEKKHIIMNVSFEDSTINLLYKKYVAPVKTVVR